MPEVGRGTHGSEVSIFLLEAGEQAAGQGGEQHQEGEPAEMGRWMGFPADLGPLSNQKPSQGSTSW